MPHYLYSFGWKFQLVEGPERTLRRERHHHRCQVRNSGCDAINQLLAVNQLLGPSLRLGGSGLQVGARLQALCWRREVHIDAGGQPRGAGGALLERLGPVEPLRPHHHSGGGLTFSLTPNCCHGNEHGAAVAGSPPLQSRRWRWRPNLRNILGVKRGICHWVCSRVA